MSQIHYHNLKKRKIQIQTGLKLFFKPQHMHGRGGGGGGGGKRGKWETNKSNQGVIVLSGEGDPLSHFAYRA